MRFRASPATAGHEDILELEPLLRRVVAARVRDPDTVDDLVQEALAKVIAVRARLDDEARIEEIARMLGGAAVTVGIRASARELLVGRQAGRHPDRRPGESKAKGESERAKAKGRKQDGLNS